MGVDYRVYVGPYIKVHNPEKPSTESYHTCSNKSCKQHGSPMSNGFCPICGSCIKLQEFPCESRIVFDVYTESGKTLGEAVNEYKPDGLEDYLFFAPVGEKDFSISFDPSNGNHVIPINFTNAIEHIKTFGRVFKNEIEEIKKVFGNDAVSIEYGILSWMW